VSALDCRDEQRRGKVRRENLNGLDYLEVSDDQRTLTVFFLGKAPDEIAEANVVIEGGRRVRGIKVVWIGITRQDDPELDDCMQVLVDKIGDFSTYTLRLAELDGEGRPADEPFHGFDPRYDRLPFSFKVGCPSDFDCAVEDSCPPIERPEPAIDYLAKDYSSFRRLMLDRLSLVAPEWRERNPADLGIALVELLAYVGDSLSYFQDAVATEAYLGTARRRVSVRRHLRLVDYRLHEGCNARAWVCVDTDTDLAVDPQELVFLAGEDDATAEPFEPVGTDTIELVAAHSRIRFWTWGDRDCCLELGATAATLRDEWVEPPEPEDEGGGPVQTYQQAKPSEDGERERRLRLTAGDVLVVEEVLGPRTGVEGDADRSHRHAVLLTRVTQGVDELYGQPVVDVEWAAADALPFSLCISSTKPDCTPVDDVSVACGNIFLVEHGRRVGPDELGTVPTVEVPGGCDCAGRPAEPSVVAGRFEPPALARSPVTFSEPLGELVSASSAIAQDARRAVPRVVLQGTPASPHPATEDWSPALDLLAASPADRSFVVEVDDQEIARVRFGDGERGRLPSPGESFVARYRVGNGTRGNVGAERISRLVFLGETVEGASMRVSNPLPAVGGTDPEPVADAKLLGPSAFRAELRRAVTADDYARLAECDDARLQRAAASLEWTGSWYEARVAVDPLGTEEPDAGLLGDVGARLERYRRIGHDVAVVPATYVPLDLALTVCVFEGFLRAHVELAARDVLSTRRLPDGRLGLFHPDNESFGREVALSTIVAAVQAVAGVESVIVTRLQRLDEPPAGELEQGFLRLGRAEIARLDNDPSFRERGRLTLDVRGGR
jgi:hypothetical protein